MRNIFSRKPTVRTVADTPSARRIELLDELRGLAVLCMIFYHGFYIGSAFFGIDFCLSLFDFFTPAQPFFAALFIFLCGVSSNLSRNNAKRGTQLFLIALALSVVTVYIAPRFGLEGAQIRFGILHLLSVSILLYALFSPIAGKINPLVGASVSALLYAVSANVKSGFFGIGALSLELPRSLYATDALFPLGFVSDDFFSADYFPLLPHFFIFMCGAFLGVYAKNGRIPQYFYKRRVPALSFLGKRAIICYLVHAPAAFALFYIANLIIERF